MDVKHQGSFHDWIDKEIRDAHQEITLKGIRGKKGVGGGGFLTDYPDVKTIKDKYSSFNVKLRVVTSCLEYLIFLASSQSVTEFSGTERRRETEKDVSRVYVILLSHLGYY